MTIYGPYTEGDYGDGITDTFYDDADEPLDLSHADWVATFTFRRWHDPADQAITEDATVDDAGTVSYVWAEGDLTAGVWWGVFTLTNATLGIQRVGDRHAWRVAAHLESAAS